MDATTLRLMQHHSQSWAELRDIVTGVGPVVWIELLKSLHEGKCLFPHRVRALDDEVLLALVRAGMVSILTIIDRESGVPV